jgi:ERF superfamily
MENEIKLNLYQKLLEIQKEVIGLGKNKKSNSYEYVTGSKVLEHIKPIMNKHNLMLKQEVLSIENIRQDYKTGIGTQYEKPKSEILSKVMMRFTWIDCDTGDKDENLFGANGQNDWEKGLGSALTYGERYFLLKYFHIATDEDDIDNPDRKPVEQVAPPSNLPYLNQNTKEWTSVLDTLKNGYTDKNGVHQDCTLVDVRKKFRISAENQKLLQEQVLS